MCGACDRAAAREARKAAREAEKRETTLQVHLGRRDVSRAVPVSAYARKAATEDQAATPGGHLEVQQGAPLGAPPAFASLAQQKRAERNQSLTAQKAEDRFNAIKHLVIALGEYVVLRLQDHSPLSSGHCVLQPVEHVAALSEARQPAAATARSELRAGACSSSSAGTAGRLNTRGAGADYQTLWSLCGD
jgi:hypothetical protein